MVVVDAGTSKKKEVPRLYRIAPYHWIGLGIGTDDSSDRGWFFEDTHDTTKRWSLIGMAGGVSECSGMSDGWAGGIQFFFLP